MADPWKDEQDRQSQDLLEIIQREINEYGKSLKSEGKAPMLNAVAGALVSAMGAVLASVDDRRIRKELRRVMDRGLPRAIAAHEGHVGSAEIIVQNRRSN
ncbi:hypothetical protein [Phyllobacterium calauticae]|jgi:hypothetical protein|uniref:hypothetical protein n=1 Tax=Phyllobacterium calauticae TaxID=2817027 RepID=UPI001CBD627B|nr:hypothetical protein [Phyllobacterium calauticae]MBZ3691031.1 hypothetical protein [Phyllobacterium calauticae]